MANEPIPADGDPHLANGHFQHSQGQRPWNANDPARILANGHIQPLNIAVGENGMGGANEPRALP